MASAINKSIIAMFFVIFSTSFLVVHALEPYEIKENNKKSMVFLKFNGVLPDGKKSTTSATGYIIDKKGYVLTNYHVIPQDKDGSFEQGELKISGHVISRHAFGKPVDLIEVNKLLDLALLKFRTVEGIEITPVKCGDPAKVRQGDKVVSLGFPLNIDLSVHIGRISSTEYIGGKWVSNLPLNYGDSGGPVFNMDGDWVAISKSAITGENIENIKVIIPRNHANNLINLTNACNGNTSLSSADVERIKSVQLELIRKQKELEDEEKRRLALINSCKSQAKYVMDSCTAVDQSGLHSSPFASCSLSLEAPKGHFFAAGRVVVVSEGYRRISGESAVNAVKPQYRNINGNKLIVSYQGSIACTNDPGTGRTCESKATIRQLTYPLSCSSVADSL